VDPVLCGKAIHGPISVEGAIGSVRRKCLDHVNALKCRSSPPRAAKLPTHGGFTLGYRIDVSPKAWTRVGLEAGQKEYLKKK
jgi:hypothetical protein